MTVEESNPTLSTEPGFQVMDSDPLVRVQRAIDDIRSGRMVILVDDEDRENEGDLCMAADAITPQAINFMATHGRGLICVTLTGERIDHLGLPMMASNNQSPYHTAFTVSIEAREGVSTGISAADRAHTIRVAVDPSKGPNDLVIPGHIFPLKARDGGVLVRTGQTEGSVDLARMAGLSPAGVICEVMNPDGTMARLPDLKAFGEEHNIRVVTVADLIRWRIRNEVLVEKVAEGPLNIASLGEFQAHIYRSHTDQSVHLAVTKGDLSTPDPVLTRVQLADPVSDVFGSLNSTSGATLYLALAHIAHQGRGALLYLHLGGEGTSEDLLARLQRSLLGENPASSSAAEEIRAEIRELGTGAQILVDLGAQTLRVMTNSPKKIVGLEGYGLQVSEHVPIEVPKDMGDLSFENARAIQLKDLLPGNIS